MLSFEETDKFCGDVKCGGTEFAIVSPVGELCADKVTWGGPVGGGGNDGGGP